MQVDQVRVRWGQEPIQHHRVSMIDMALEGRVLHTPHQDYDFAMEPDSMRSFAQYFGVPYAYLNKLPDALVESNLRHFMDRVIDSQVLMETEGPALLNVFSGDTGLIDRMDFVGVLENVMKPDDRVVRASYYRGQVRFDVVTQELKTEPREGDFTAAGLTITGHVSPVVKPPVVGGFMERLACLNGMRTTEPDGEVVISGNTIPEIISEMELAAYRVLSSMDERLEQWASLTEVAVDNVEQMIHRLATESRISAQVESRILDTVPAAEGDTLYDVVNLMTAMHAEDGISDVQVSRLQEMAGRVLQTRGSHRCPSCAHILGD